jgi:cytosolic 5'-nucleotidase 3
MQKIQEIIMGGAENLQLVVDFDRTLIKGFADGVEVPSANSILRNENHLDVDYMSRAHALYNEYRPIETDTNISHEEKSKKMHEWWSRHYDLKIEKKLNIKHLKDASNSKLIQLRPYTKEMFEICRDKNIPVVILSASGLGFDSIKFVLEKNNILFSNVHIVSNQLIYDDEGHVTGYKEPIIHSQNKSEEAIKDFELRKNTVLIGDGLGDAKMVNDKQGRVVYRLGLYDMRDSGKLEMHKNTFDEVVSSLDGEISFENVCDTLKEIK